MKPGWLWILPTAVACLPVYSPYALPAGVYTWRDDNGVVHFSDRAPQQVDAQKVVPATPVLVPMKNNLGAAEAIAESLATPVASDEPTSGNRRKNDDQAQRCQRYRQQLETIQSQLRAGYTNAQGNRLRERRRSLSRKLGRECVLG